MKLSNLNTAKWTPVETAGWVRRAYGRRIMLESEGGTLRTRLLPGATPRGQLAVHLEVTGRMLVQMFCDGEQVFDDLVSHGGIDTLIDLSSVGSASCPLEVELHLIPATFGTVKVAQDLKLVDGAERVRVA